MHSRFYKLRYTKNENGWFAEKNYMQFPVSPFFKTKYAARKWVAENWK